MKLYYKLYNIATMCVMFFSNYNYFYLQNKNMLKL